MESGQEFVDYYSLLQADPTCDAKMLEQAYRHFARMYHPDHPETADATKFQEIIEAYSVLRDTDKRAKYDLEYRQRRPNGSYRFSKNEEARIDEKSPMSDAEVHEKILFHLYKQRREHADDPGVIGYYIQKMIDCSDDNYEFHVWYLKSKGLIHVTEHGTLAITIEGVDHVISLSRTIEAERLLIPQSYTDED
jgi:curved DNA-binding protein